MPVWMSIGAHFLIDGERLNAQKILGLIISMVGFFRSGLGRGVWDLGWGPDEHYGSMCWAGIGRSVR